MRIFEHPNMADFKCPICGTADDKPVVLIGIDGTESGRNIQARQYHVACIDLREAPPSRGEAMLYQIYTAEAKPSEKEEGK